MRDKGEQASATEKFPDEPPKPSREDVVRKKGDFWLHPITGTEYVWDGEVYVSTGKKPYGADPMGLLGW